MNFLRIFILAPWLLGLSLAAQAELLIGLGHVEKLTGPSIEWAGEHNSFYAMPAYKINGNGINTDELRWVAGIRHRLERGLTSESGFYSGFIVGDFGKHRYERLGAGLQLGHQWVKQYTRIAIDGGMVALERDPVLNFRTEPLFILGVTLSLRK